MDGDQVAMACQQPCRWPCRPVHQRQRSSTESDIGEVARLDRNVDLSLAMHSPFSPVLDILWLAFCRTVGTANGRPQRSGARHRSVCTRSSIAVRSNLRVCRIDPKSLSRRKMKASLWLPGCYYRQGYGSQSGCLLLLIALLNCSSSRVRRLRERLEPCKLDS